MNLIPRITVRSTESLFEFFLNNALLEPEKTLELLEDLSTKNKSSLWAFKRTGESVSIYHFPGEPFEVTIRQEYIVVPHGRSHTILAWLPSNVSSQIVSVAKDISVRLESFPSDPEAVDISLAQFLK